MVGCCVVTYIIDTGHLGASATPLYLLDDELLGTFLILVLAAIAGIIGILQAMAVSGADMAVVICVLNSGSGWSGVAAGFMISNELLLVTGRACLSSSNLLVQAPVPHWSISRKCDESPRHPVHLSDQTKNERTQVTGAFVGPPFFLGKPEYS